MPEPLAPRHDLAVAARDTWVIWASMYALGIGFGVLVASHGFAWWLAPLISATVYAGSAEFILIGLLAAGAPVLTIATTTLLTNFRHLFYGLSFPLHRVRGRIAKGYSVFSLTDEAYALMSAKAPDTLTSPRILWTQVGLHVSWTSGGLTGGLVGQGVLGDVEGLDFILTALFLVLAMDAYRARPDNLTLLIAVGCAVTAQLIAPGSMLLVAMTGFAVVLAFRHRLATGARRA